MTPSAKSFQHIMQFLYVDLWLKQRQQITIKNMTPVILAKTVIVASRSSRLSENTSSSSAERPNVLFSQAGLEVKTHLPVARP